MGHAAHQRRRNVRGKPTGRANDGQLGLGATAAVDCCISSGRLDELCFTFLRVLNGNGGGGV